MKKIAQKLLVLIAALFVGGAALNAQAATFNNDPADLQTFLVKNATQNPSAAVGWGTSVTANPGDTLSFNVYYHNTAADAATNARVFMNVPTGSSANTFTANGGIGAGNAPTVSNSVTINVNGAPQTLTFIPGTFKWYPNQDATRNGTPTTVPPNGQAETAMLTSSGGINLGTIPAAPSIPNNSFTYQGNVVMQFRVGNAGNGTPNPVNQVTVSTNPATSITQDQATFNGFVNANGNSFVTARFEYGPNGQFIYTTPSQTFGNTSTNYSFTQTGLSPNTNYVYRAIASGQSGTIVYGNTQSFTTGQNNQVNSTTPTVTTNFANATDTTCTMSGTLQNPGTGYGSALVWFEYGPNFSFGSRTMTQSLSSGSFTAVAQGLAPNTTYQFRAVAQNGAGTSYGNTLTCVTGQNFFPINPINPAPINAFVETRPATFVAFDSAVLNGAVSIPQFAPQNVTVWFDYGRTPAFGSRTLPQTIPTNGGVLTPFSRVALSLSPSSTYYFRAVAQLPNGQLAFGNPLSFVTTPTPVTVTPVTPTYVAPSGPTGFSGVRIEKHGVNLTFPNGAHDCFAVRPGDTVEFSIVVKNVNSSTPATNLTVRDSISPMFDFLGASQGGMISGSEVVWNIGTLAAGETRTLNFQLRARSFATNTNAENIARVSNGVAKELLSNKVTMIMLATPGVQTASVSTGVVDQSAAVVGERATTFLSGFFPETALGWLGLLILIIFIGVLIRALM